MRRGEASHDNGPTSTAALDGVRFEGRKFRQAGTKDYLAILGMLAATLLVLWWFRLELTPARATAYLRSAARTAQTFLVPNMTLPSEG